MTFLELQTELNNRIAAAKVSGFWSADMKKQWINNAGERVSNYYRWKALECVFKTITKKDQEYYDYPDQENSPNEFQENSIYYMEIDGKIYDKRTWEEYQKVKKAGGDDKIFCSYDGLYFVNPTPDKNNIEIAVWGIRKWIKLVNNTDNPITPSELDEPIIKLALATCLQKERRYSEASAEIVEVEAPRDSKVPGSGGLLARLAAREEDEGPKGYIGRAKSTRWMK